MKLIIFTKPSNHYYHVILLGALISSIQSASSTITVQPSTGRATLIYGQNLNLECAQVGNDKAYFKW